MDLPTTPPHQRRLHEIVAEDVAAKRLAPVQCGQPGLPGEGGGADHGVVAPIVALRAVPPGNAVRDWRPVHPTGELLQAGEQRTAIGDGGECLDQPDRWVLCHRRRQPHQRLASHYAIGIQDQELAVTAAPAPHPVGNVAGLALGILRPATIKQAGSRAEPLTQRQIMRLLVHPHIGVRRVAEDEDVELIAVSSGGQRGMDRLQSGHHAGGLLVIGRHEQCRPHRERRQSAATDAQPPPASQQAGNETGDRGAERERDPREQRHEQHQQQHDQRGYAAGVQHTQHLVRGTHGHRDRRHDHQCPA